MGTRDFYGIPRCQYQASGQQCQKIAGEVCDWCSKEICGEHAVVTIADGINERFLCPDDREHEARIVAIVAYEQAYHANLAHAGIETQGTQYGVYCWKVEEQYHLKWGIVLPPWLGQSRTTSIHLYVDDVRLPMSWDSERGRELRSMVLREGQIVRVEIWHALHCLAVDRLLLQGKPEVQRLFASLHSTQAPLLAISFEGNGEVE